MRPPIHSLQLERFVLGELSEVDREAMENEIAANPVLRQSVDALKASHAELLEAHPASVMGEAIRQRAKPRPAPRRPMLRFAVAASLGVAGLVVAFGLGREGGNAHTPPEITRVKGASSALRVFRKTATSSEVLGSGDRAVAGDLVRLGYQTPTRRFGMIVSIDGKDSVTRHWPASGSMAAPMQAGELVLLDQAFELDDAPRFERFYLVTSDHAFAADLVLAALRNGRESGSAHALALPPGFEQVSVELQKETSR